MFSGVVRMAESWLAPRRLLLLVFGVGVSCYLVLPAVIIAIMGFSSSQFLQFPPPGFSLRWYARMISDPAWSQALSTSFAAAVLVVPAAMCVRGLRPDPVSAGGR